MIVKINFFDIIHILQTVPPGQLPPTAQTQKPPAAQGQLPAAEPATASMHCFFFLSF